jgi:hypothetical protein
MGKGGAHSARRKTPRTSGRRKQDTGAMLIALCVFAVVGMAAAYDLTHEQESQASASLPARAAEETKRIAGGLATEAAAKEMIENIAQPPSTTVIEEHAAKKEDRLVTGSLSKPDELAPAKIEGKADPKASANKKKSGVATVKTGTSGTFDIFARGQTSSPPN